MLRNAYPGTCAAVKAAFVRLGFHSGNHTPSAGSMTMAMCALFAALVRADQDMV